MPLLAEDKGRLSREGELGGIEKDRNAGTCKRVRSPYGLRLIKGDIMKRRKTDILCEQESRSK